MKKYIYILLLAVTFTSINEVKSQYAYFPQEGTITYDKTVHVKNLIRRHISTLKDDDWSKKYYEELMGKVNETAVLKKKLSFRGREFSVESIKETYDPMIANLLNAGILDYQSTVYQNLDKNQMQLAFEIGGSNILINDSLLNVKWKITNEYRNIAGYECRRANGLTLDSVYVVAFYTDQIPTSGAPGSIQGLPGMVLGYIVPEQHFNIYATKVDFSPPTIKTDLSNRKKDKPMTREEMKVQLKNVLGQWMNDKQFNLLIAAMLL